MPSNAKQVFLCHSSGDKAAVRELWARLRADGHHPWLDEQDILPGQDWELEIRRAVRASQIVLVCLSKGSISKSGYVQKEIRFALDVADAQPEGAIFLIPVRLEDCQVPERLGRWQWVDLFQPTGYERLLRTLEATQSEVHPGAPVPSASLPAAATSQTPRSGAEIAPPRRPMLEVLSWIAGILGAIVAAAAYFAPPGTFVTATSPPLPTAPAPAASPPHPTTYKSCRRPEFGVERWLRSEEFSQSSGWRDGGRSQQDWCNELIAATVQGRALGPEHLATVVNSSEDSNKDWKGHVTYNYSCTVRISWQPLYAERQDPACGVQ